MRHSICRVLNSSSAITLAAIRTTPCNCPQVPAWRQPDAYLALASSPSICSRAIHPCAFMRSNQCPRMSRLMLASDTAFPVTVNEGDVVACDENGVVVFPPYLLPTVLERCAKLVDVDAKCLAAIQSGSSAAEAFATYR